MRSTLRKQVSFFLAGLLAGGIGGIFFGTQFDLRGEVDWVAVGSVASFFVVVVALVPIGLEYRRRLHQTRSTRDHVLALLIEIDTLLDLRLSTPQLGAFGPIEAAPINELFALIPQLDLLDEAEARHVITAAGKSRVLVLVGARPNAAFQQTGFQDALAEVQKALEVVRARSRPSMREA